MDKIPVNKIRAFEDYLIEHVRAHHPEVLTEVRDEKNIKDENLLAERVKEVVADFLRK